jgi:magnesium-transporting ATPase (P-type)
MTKLKRWKALKADRDVLEQDSIFLGLLILQNRMKPESPGVISELRAANIKTVMVTGDNILTAVSVSTECGLISRNDQVIIPDVIGKCHKIINNLRKDAFQNLDFLDAIVQNYYIRSFSKFRSRLNFKI